MDRYTSDALDALTTARRANPDVSQRRLARNIFMLRDLDSRWDGGEAVQSTLDLFRELGYPSEIALQHLIRRIDRLDAASAANNRSRAARNQTPRNRKTAYRGRRIKV